MFSDSLLSELNVLRKRQEGSLTAFPDPNDVVYLIQVNIGGERQNFDFDLEVQIFKLLLCYMYGKVLTAVIVRSSLSFFLLATKTVITSTIRPRALRGISLMPMDLELVVSLEMTPSLLDIPLFLAN